MKRPVLSECKNETTAIKDERVEMGITNLNNLMCLHQQHLLKGLSQGKIEDALSELCSLF